VSEMSPSFAGESLIEVRRRFKAGQTIAAAWSLGVSRFGNYEALTSGRYFATFLRTWLSFPHSQLRSSLVPADGDADGVPSAARAFPHEFKPP
jgi:hypothetical protein